jgi:hypothetical protein
MCTLSFVYNFLWIYTGFHICSYTGFHIKSGFVHRISYRILDDWLGDFPRLVGWLGFCGIPAGLVYCKMDTMAMVGIYRKLKDIVTG